MSGAAPALLEKPGSGRGHVHGAWQAHTPPLGRAHPTVLSLAFQLCTLAPESLVCSASPCLIRSLKTESSALERALPAEVSRPSRAGGRQTQIARLPTMSTPAWWNPWDQKSQFSAFKKLWGLQFNFMKVSDLSYKMP